MFFTLVRSRNSALIVGLVSVAIATAFMVFGKFYNKNNLIDAAQWLGSIGVAITSLGIAAHSIIISKESDKKLLVLANKSDEKMKSIANVNFLQVVNMLEDARIEFNKTLMFIDSQMNPKKYNIPIYPGYSPETFTWKTKSCVEMAVELLKKDESKKYIDPDYQDKLFHYFNMSFKHFFKIQFWNKKTNSKKHLIESYALLDDYYNYQRRKELKDYIKPKKEKYFKNFYSEAAKKKIKDK